MKLNKCLLDKRYDRFDLINNPPTNLTVWIVPQDHGWGINLNDTETKHFLDSPFFGFSFGSFPLIQPEYPIISGKKNKHN